MSTLEKAGLDPKDLEGFSGDTLDQLAMEKVDGGQLGIDLDGKCHNTNCVAGCACTAKAE